MITRPKRSRDPNQLSDVATGAGSMLTPRVNLGTVFRAGGEAPITDQRRRAIIPLGRRCAGLTGGVWSVWHLARISIYITRDGSGPCWKC
jgi:hypothetical protein